MTNEVKKGDYVLATKWGDGDSRDHWVVGFYDELKYGDRHIILDGDGVSFRPGGFRRAAKISANRGAFIIKHTKEIEAGSRSLWWWKRCSMKETT